VKVINETRFTTFVNVGYFPLQTKRNYMYSQLSCNYLVNIFCDNFIVSFNFTFYFSLQLHNIVRSNEILGWGGVGNRQLLCFFTAQINWRMLTANLKFRAIKSFFFFSFFSMFYIKNRIT
jgi:hypothetical protein